MNYERIFRLHLPLSHGADLQAIINYIEALERAVSVEM
jgi:hypothetical protein